MNPFFVGWRAGRRRSSPSLPRRARRPAIVLVALELGWLAGRLARPSRLLPALAVGVTTAVLLAPVTPGPVLGAGARVGAAAAGATLAALVAHMLLERVGDEDASSTMIALVGVATVGMLLGAIVVLTYLLAAISPTAVDEGRLVGGGLTVDRSVAVIAALLIAGVLVTGLGDRLRVPGSIALLVLGMVVGSDGLGWVVVEDPLRVQAVAVVALVVILYEGGLTTRLHALRGAVVPGVVLATVGVAITAAVVAIVGSALLGLDGRLALLLAAVVSSTDAAAVFAVLRRAPVPRRLAGLLQVESGTNDPVAVLLTVGILSGTELGTTPATWLGFAIAQIGLGVGLGVAIGLVGAWLLGHVRPAAASLVPVLALGVGAAAYGVAAVAGGSGFLAVYVCGITIAARSPADRRPLRSFHEGLATTVEVGLFLLLGLLVFPAQLPAVIGVGLGVVAVLLLLARPLAVAVTLAPFGFAPRELAAVSWLGMRGAVPIVLATVAFSAGYEEATLLLDIVFVVVLVSLLLQGITAPGVLRRAGLDASPSPNELAIDSTPFEGAEGELVDLVLDSSSPIVGRRLGDAPPPDGVLVTAVVRNGRILVPRGGTTLVAGDHLVVVSERPAASALRRWAAPAGTHDLTTRR